MPNMQQFVQPNLQVTIYAIIYTHILYKHRKIV